MPEYDPVAKISIVPRGAAGGLTFFSPSEERLESGLYRYILICAYILMWLALLTLCKAAGVLCSCNWPFSFHQSSAKSFCVCAMVG